MRVHSSPPSTATEGHEVVAGMANDGSAEAVATAAVALARRLGGRVRFVQVLPDTLTDEARADAESTMFSTALRALHGGPRIQATFEAPLGDPAKVLVKRSRQAVRLVVGTDQRHLDHEGTVAAYCLLHAGCAVDVVPHDQDQDQDR